MAAHVSPQRGSDLGIVEALGGSASRLVRPFQAVGDDLVALLQDQGILRELLAIGSEQTTDPGNVLTVDRPIEREGERVLSVDALMLGRDGVRVRGFCRGLSLRRA